MCEKQYMKGSIMKTQKATDFQKLNKNIHSLIGNINVDKKTKEIIIEMYNTAISGGDNDIKLNFDDFKGILSCDKIFVGSDYNESQNLTEVIKQSIFNSSLDYNSVDKISNMLIHFTIHPDLSLMNIADAMDKIYNLIHQDANVLWGTTTKKSINKNYIKVMVLFNENKQNFL